MKQKAKKKAKDIRHAYRLSTAAMRALPDFLIIGAQKSGTTYLFRLLAQHPDVLPAFHKEIHYFDLNFRKGDGWYRSHFPLRQRVGKGYVTGESSPYYLFHPHAARRASSVVPEAKLVVLMRNPVDRAYSHYHHQKVRAEGDGHEALTFEMAIETEEKRLPGEIAKMLEDETYASSIHRDHSYLSRGIYVDQLRAWEEFFDKRQMLVLKSEDMFDDMPATLGRVADFLGIRRWTPEAHFIPNKREYVRVSPGLRQKLEAYFEPHNRRLYDHLGVDLGW